MAFLHVFVYSTLCLVYLWKAEGGEVHVDGVSTCVCVYSTLCLVFFYMKFTVPTFE